jgi:hypothetical protein
MPIRKLICSLCFIPFFSFGTVVTDGFYQIKNVWVWGQDGGSVLKVHLHNQNSEIDAYCPGGYWLDYASTNGKHVLDVAMSAYNNKTKIRMYANENKDWGGMSTKECKIGLIELEPSTLG